jgi:hypothetical protein
MAYQDLNNSTQINSTAHAATSAGQLFASGYGLILVVIGVLFMIGAILTVILSFTKLGGR